MRMINDIIWIIVLTICIVIDAYILVSSINSNQHSLITMEIVAIIICAIAIVLHIVHLHL